MSSAPISHGLRTAPRDHDELAEGEPPEANADPAQHGLRTTWPLHRRQLGQLAAGWAVLTLLWIAMGKLITGPFEGGAIVRTDVRAAEWLAQRRTPTWNSLTFWGSYLAETLTKVVVTAVVALVLLKVWRRWLEPLVVAVALVVEAAAFIVVTNIVGRPRPDVPRLDGSPVDSSFPSGHVAAAAAYGAFAVIVCWHTRKWWPRLLAVGIATTVTLIVSLSRAYRGMHFASDIVAGVVLGCGSVLLAVAVLGRSPEGARFLAARGGQHDSTEGDPCPS